MYFKNIWFVDLGVCNIWQPLDSVAVLLVAFSCKCHVVSFITSIVIENS